MTGRTFPTRSAGVRWEALGDGLLLHDEVRQQVHLLGAPGTLVWASCDGQTLVDDVAVEVAGATGLAVEQVAADLGRHLDHLTVLGLVGRGDLGPGIQLAPPLRADGDHRAGPFRVLDAAVEVVADDPALLDAARPLLADLIDATPWAPAEHVEVGLVGRGRAVGVVGRGFDDTLPAGDAALEALVGQFNRACTWAAAPLALHAGAVQAPDGRVVAVCGPSGSGKSTLVAQLVADGWRYLTDEALGLRSDLTTVAYPKPLALSPASRAAVGLAAGPGLVRVHELHRGAAAAPGDAGPLAAIVVATYRPGALEAASLPVEGAVAQVAPNAINLAPAGQPGLRTLVRALASVPVIQLDHAGGAAVTRWFADLVRSA